MRAVLLLSLSCSEVIWAGPLGVTEEVGPEDEERRGANLVGVVFGGLHRVDAEFEALLNDDIEVMRTAAQFEEDLGRWNWNLLAAYTHHSVDYEQALVGHPAHLEEDLWQLSFGLDYALSDSVELGVNVSAYDGHPDYRSIWINEYYKQFFGFLPEYRNSDPHGAALSVSGVWSYQSGLVEGGGGYGWDQVVPGWEFDGGGLSSSSDEVETGWGYVRWEQVINPWLKTELNGRASFISRRDPRYQISNRWAVAFGPKLSAKATVGAAKEDPQFEAVYGGVNLDYEFQPNWTVTLSGRLYHDTGEIESAAFNTAAPGVDTSEVGVGLLWDRGDLAVRIFVGYYAVDYDKVSAENQFFRNLYKDRDWVVLRLATTLRF